MSKMITGQPMGVFMGKWDSKSHNMDHLDFLTSARGALPPPFEDRNHGPTSFESWRKTDHSHFFCPIIEREGEPTKTFPVQEPYEGAAGVRICRKFVPTYLEAAKKALTL